MHKKAATLANGVQMTNFSAAHNKLEKKANVDDKIKVIRWF